VDRQILEDLLAFVGGVTTVGCFTAVMITWIKLRAGKRLSGDVTQRLDEIANLLARLETQTEATALEVERISEAQRFTTKLLADRAGAGVGAPSS